MTIRNEKKERTYSLERNTRGNVCELKEYDIERTISMIRKMYYINSLMLSQHCCRSQSTIDTNKY